MNSDLIPFAPNDQRAISQRWNSLVGARAPADDLKQATGIRPVVRESWYRTAAANVPPDLKAAPTALDENAVHIAQERSDWLPIAHEAVARQPELFVGDGHILTLFDHIGRMLYADGDPAALEGLAEVNFRPGGQWSENVVGTNGPGTALATGKPIHIVGAEHFAERLHKWHCAAVPVRDTTTGKTIGVVDISGFREHAHPHTLALASALGVAIEQALAARDARRRYAILQRNAQLAASYPGDPIITIDRAGRVLNASSGIASTMITALVDALRKFSAAQVAADGIPVIVNEREAAKWFPAHYERAIVGGCLVLTPPRDHSRVEWALEHANVRATAQALFDAGARDLGRLKPQVAPEVFAALEAYHWPGGVQELKHVIRRVLMATSETIAVTDLPHVVREAYAEVTDAQSSPLDAEDAELMEVVRASATMAEAAAKLGITRSTLYRRMERFGLKPKRVLGRS